KPHIGGSQHLTIDFQLLAALSQVFDGRQQAAVLLVIFVGVYTGGDELHELVFRLPVDGSSNGKEEAGVSAPCRPTIAGDAVAQSLVQLGVFWLEFHRRPLFLRREDLLWRFR